MVCLSLFFCREILYVLTNKFYDSKEEYYQSITLGMMQACSGLSLMMGYSNPWAVMLRKQCETTALALQGLYDLFIAVVVDVPFSKCLCVDAAAAGANFETYAMKNCFYFAPNHLKPLLLGMIQNALVDGGGGIKESCRAVTEFASSSVSDSMKPFFTSQLQATAQIASSVDYLMKFIDKNAGRCMDFEVNPYAAVLIPEPMDYFAACAR